MKVVLDTNVLLSGLMFPEGTPGRIDVGSRRRCACRGEAPLFVSRLSPTASSTSWRMLSGISKMKSNQNDTDDAGTRRER